MLGFFFLRLYKHNIVQHISILLHSLCDLISIIRSLIIRGIMKRFLFVSFLILVNLHCSEKQPTLLQSLQTLRRTFLHEVEELHEIGMNSLICFSDIARGFKLVMSYKKAHALLGTFSGVQIQKLFKEMAEGSPDKKIMLYDQGRLLATFDSTMIPGACALYEQIRAGNFSKAPQGGITTFIGNGKRRKKAK